MSALLRHQVMQLRLRPEAPFPAECQDHRDMVKSWRRLQRLHLAGAGDSARIGRFDPFQAQQSASSGRQDG